MRVRRELYGINVFGEKEREPKRIVIETVDLNGYSELFRFEKMCLGIGKSIAYQYENGEISCIRIQGSHEREYIRIIG